MSSRPTGPHGSGHFTHLKAGMSVDVSDRARIERIIAEASVGSAFAANAASRDAALAERLSLMKAAVAKTPADILARHEATLAAYALKLEACRTLRRVKVVVDADAFFAAVEARDNPSLAGKAFAVGSMSMISTASYEARKYGVRSAMPGFIAVKLCPSLIFLPVNFSKYEIAAEAMRDVLRRYDPAVRCTSLDEAVLDLTAVCEREGVFCEEDEACAPTLSQQAQIAAIVARMRAEIKAATHGLTCSAGVSSSSSVAKVASNVNKPDGQCLVFGAAEIAAFMRPRPLRELSGVGKVTEAMLLALGLTTCADAVTPSSAARAWAGLGENAARWLVATALGCSRSEVDAAEGRTNDSNDDDDDSGVGRKSISAETSFAPCSVTATLVARVRELASGVAQQMANEAIAGATVTVKIKHSSFSVQQRAFSLPSPTADAAVLMTRAEALLRSLLPANLRLVGVRVSGLVPATEAPSATSAASYFAAQAQLRPDSSSASRSVPSASMSTAAATAAVAASSERIAPSAKRPRTLDCFFARSSTASSSSRTAAPPPPQDGPIVIGSDDEDADELLAIVLSSPPDVVILDDDYDDHENDVHHLVSSNGVRGVSTSAARRDAAAPLDLSADLAAAAAWPP